MMSRLFLVYVLVELAVLVALASTIGLGWTLLLLLAAFVAGLALAGSQLKRQLGRLRSGLTTRPAAARHRRRDGRAGHRARGGSRPGHHRRRAAASVAADPGRRPSAADGDGGTRHRSTCTADHGHHRRRGSIRIGAPPRPDYIDGEVIDVTDVADFTEVDPPALPGGPSRPIQRDSASPRRCWSTAGSTARPTPMPPRWRSATVWWCGWAATT